MSTRTTNRVAHASCKRSTRSNTNAKDREASLFSFATTAYSRRPVHGNCDAQDGLVLHIDDLLGPADGVGEVELHGSKRGVRKQKPISKSCDTDNNHKQGDHGKRPNKKRGEAAATWKATRLSFPASLSSAPSVACLALRRHAAKAPRPKPERQALHSAPSHPQAWEC